jgi:hypothetical protein
MSSHTGDFAHPRLRVALYRSSAKLLALQPGPGLVSRLLEQLVPTMLTDIALSTEMRQSAARSAQDESLRTAMGGRGGQSGVSFPRTVVMHALLTGACAAPGPRSREAAARHRRGRLDA